MCKPRGLTEYRHGINCTMKGPGPICRDLNRGRRQHSNQTLREDSTAPDMSGPNIQCSSVGEESPACHIHMQWHARCFSCS